MHGISNGTTRFVFGANGNVGVGIDNPGDKLVVHQGADDDIIVRVNGADSTTCLLYTSPSPRDKRQSRMPSSA